MDLLEAPDAAAVEADPLGKEALGQLRGRHAEVLPLAEQVAEAEVDELDALVPSEGDYRAGIFNRCRIDFALDGHDHALPPLYWRMHRCSGGSLTLAGALTIVLPTRKQ